MQIRDLECKTALDRATIRFYEKEGLIVPERKENGYREYSEEILNDLLKIKLLRQLGMSLDTIKKIRQGSADFNLALSTQIRNLQNVMQAAARAKEVCEELYRANTSYQELNAVYYLQELDKQLTKIPKKNFREYVQRPYHPIRRFLARVTDYALLRMLLEFLLVVILRIRPYSQFLSGLIAYGVPFLMIPISAFLLSKWGTTPGKWLFGLSVLSENGCRLTYADAVTREWRALAEGYGFGIPVWALIRLYKSYISYQKYDLDWDMFCEYQFVDWCNRNKVIVSLSMAILVFMNIFIVSDAVRPRYRGGVTIPQFAANYNFYSKMLDGQLDAEETMRTDGNWYPQPANRVTIDVAGQPLYPNQNFEFETEKSLIKSIRYVNKWSDVQILQPVRYNCKKAALTAVMTQKGIGFSDVMTFSKMLDSTDWLNDGNITYKNISITWDIETVNCILFDDNHYTAQDETMPSQVSVVFEIKIDNLCTTPRPRLNVSRPRCCFLI